MCLLKILNERGEKTGALILTAADGDSATEHIVGTRELCHCFFGEAHQFLCAAAQQHAISGEGDTPFAAMEEGDTELFLQLHKLARERRLSDMEKFSSAGNVFLPGHHKKILQHTKFHETGSFPGVYGISCVLGMVMHEKSVFANC